ncbi:MAG: trypsin-like peptidase domain-containing protein [Verrucomicrobiae bacterium]|nr:trypsin-like peptidase domain-containing protein [Verrucomicrobiae bacterium]
MASPKLSFAQDAAPTAAKTAPAEVDIPPPPSVQADVSEIEFESIVRVEVDTKQPNYRVPWNIGGMGNGVGTGFLVGKNHFLTNAHVVSNNRLIYIKKTNDPRPYKARVLNVAHDCDLALLEIEDPAEFDRAFSGVEPLVIGEIPKLNTTVIAVGYPIGGERISVTRGVVSRIDFRPYSHSGVDFHLTIQVDAAINPGNSGGPVLQDNKVVGVAFQGYSGAVAQNTGYMIPVPVVSRFLNDVKDGTYDHYVDLATQTINVLNPAQRVALGLPMDDVGVMVTEADPAGAAGGILKTGDVLLAIDGHVIASDGFIEIEGERVNLNEIIERKYAGDTVKLEIWRDRKRENIVIELERFIPYLIQANTYDEQPNFVLFAGLQFQPLDRNLMAAHSIKDLQVRYFYSYFSSEALYKERPQVIVLTAVLPDSANTYLQPYVQKVVDTINGKKIRVLQDVWDALHGNFSEEGHEDFHVIRCLGEGRPLVMGRATAREAHERIMAKYNVGFDNHIEEPEILKVEAVRESAKEAEKKEKKTKEKSDKKKPESSPASASAAAN